MSKGARLREQRRIQEQQKRGRRSRVPRPPGSAGRELSRGMLYAGAGGVAALIAIVLVLASVLSSGGSKPPAGNLPITAADTTKLLKGIPQHGIVLGNPKAPVTMYEWADVQCPFCAEFSGAVFPDLVRDYIRPGKVKLQFNGVVFRGSDSETGLRFALAAAQQGKMFNVLHLMYANQGDEQSGWVNDNLFASVAKHVRGLDLKQAFAVRNGKGVTNEIQAAATLTNEYRVSTTPSFAAGPTGGKLKIFHIASFDIGALRPELDKLLQSK